MMSIPAIERHTRCGTATGGLETKALPGTSNDMWICNFGGALALAVNVCVEITNVGHMTMTRASMPKAALAYSQSLDWALFSELGRRAYLSVAPSTP